MVLATIIRLEMAYPGVGILAGDSLQYLSVVTAHAVIMVFFMIMPLVFGAFDSMTVSSHVILSFFSFQKLRRLQACWLREGPSLPALASCL